MRFIELFSGIGGFRVGLEPLGMRCVFANDIDEDACEAYRRNFGGAELRQGDVRQIPSGEIPDFDLLTAGFPCQPFSHAGNNLGFEDERGNLFFQVHRIMRDKNPRAAILENVKGLLTHDKGFTIETIVGMLKGLGYAVDVALLDSSEFGVPQRRVRAYIVASKDPKEAKDPLPMAGMVAKLAKKACLCRMLPARVAERKDLSDISPTRRIGIPAALEAELRRRMAERPSKMFRVRDVRMGGHAIPTWTIGLFGEVPEGDRAVLERMREKNQRLVWDLIGKDRSKEGKSVARISPEDVGAGPGQLDRLADMGYIRRVGDRFSVINRNILPGGLPSAYVGPKAVAPTLTASNIVRFGLVAGDGVYQMDCEDLEEIQGFPRGHTAGLPERARIRLVGNSVVPAVVRWIGKTVSEIQR